MANPVVTFTMADGKVMKAELYPEVAPNTVNNFISLVKKGFYDGLIFHRVIKGFMIQGPHPQWTDAYMALLRQPSHRRVPPASPLPDQGSSCPRGIY